MIFLEPRVFYIQRHSNRLYNKDIIESFNSKDSVWQSFLSWSESTDLSDREYLTDEPDKCFLDLSQNFTIIEAAGGVVENPKEDILMIFRLGKWDLPKGKVDAGETIQATAIREVEEECGISGLKIIKTLPQTYHVYQDSNNSWMLKKTHWYLMKAKTWQHLQPQTSEHITKAEWVPKEGIHKKLEGAYRSIAELLNMYYTRST
jgi:ADP-ribose pyrophosphatase YjhB (NUDIX family)